MAKQLSDRDYVQLIRKVTTDHPDPILLPKVFAENEHRQFSKIDLNDLIYSYGKIRYRSPAIDQKCLSIIRKREGRVFGHNFYIYAITHKILSPDDIETLKNQIKYHLNHLDLKSFEIKLISKLLNILKSQGDHPFLEDLVKDYKGYLKRKNLEADQYLNRVFVGTNDIEDSHVSPQPLTSVRKVTPYLQDKLYHYLRKGGFNVELESPVGVRRMDLRVEDLCLEVDGIFHKVKRDTDEFRDAVHSDICAKAGLKYMSIYSHPDQDWKADPLLLILSKL